MTIIHGIDHQVRRRTLVLTEAEATAMFNALANRLDDDHMEEEDVPVWVSTDGTEMVFLKVIERPVASASSKEPE